LQCPAAEVESWVVRAITAGLVDARIDQEGRAVVVTRTTQRVFDAAAWKGLQTTLQQWRGTVNQLLRSTEDALGSR
jgi:translation initiation factor 3 subunit M